MNAATRSIIPKVQGYSRTRVCQECAGMCGGYAGLFLSVLVSALDKGLWCSCEGSVREIVRVAALAMVLVVVPAMVLETTLVVFGVSVVSGVVSPAS